MQADDKKHADSRRFAAFFLLLCLTFVIYGNTFQASWHLDDYHNIVQNPKLRIRDLHPRTLIQTFFAGHDSGHYQSRGMYRPIPCLSFGLNWYFGRHEVFGYHLVNIFIHFITAFILFLTILNLFKAPNLKSKYQDSEYFIALFSAVLWAVNPIQTQAVTYIVQRMASMAAMFYILGLYFYIKGRLNQFSRNQVLCYLGCGLSFVFALASKANAVTLPIAVVLAETIFFRDLNQPKTRKFFLVTTLGIGIGLVLFGALFFLHGDPFSFLKAYEDRLFTPLQRLMTEPRILVFYLTQILYPVPTRLSMAHDVSVSTSLFSPWTTLPSLLLVFLLLGIGFAQIRKRPILSYAILFFFLNHLIESTIIGLELIFEHRNYLPTLFLFFPVSAALKTLLDHYRGEKPSMHAILVAFLILLFVGLGTGTYVRNMAWATEKSLWEDAQHKAPVMGRPYHNLAWGYYEKVGQYEKAMQLYKKVLELQPHSFANKPLALNNMANLYYQKGEFSKAAALWQKATERYPQHEIFQYRWALALTKAGEWEKALPPLENVISKRPDYRDSLNLRGLIFLRQKRFEDALDCFRSSLKLKPFDKKAMGNLGIGFRLIGDYDRAEWYLKQADSLYPNDISTLFWLIDINLKTHDKIDVDRYLTKLFTLLTIELLESGIKNLADDNLMPSESRKMIIHEITRRLKRDSEMLAELNGR